MQSFDELLKAELARPATYNAKDERGNAIKKQIQPMEAMVKSVVNNAMKGDLASIAFIQNMTKDSDPQREQEARQRHLERVDSIADKLTVMLKNERNYDGQDVEIRDVAEIKAFVDELTDMMAAPDFQAVTTDMKTGKQTVSPVIALRDKQRELFQAQLEKLRQDAMSRAIHRRQLKM